MAGCRARSRPPRGELRLPRIVRDPEALEPFLHDAALFLGGHARAVAIPATEGEIAALLRAPDPVLPMGAQSSLTGGATPMGEVVLSTSRLNGIGEIQDEFARAGAGVALLGVRAALL